MFEKIGSSDSIDFYYERWRKIEAEVANELALRATDNGAINTFVLHGILSAIQAQIAQRQTLTA